jgi:hypothetical protein
MIVRLRSRKSGCVPGAESAVESAYSVITGLGGAREIAAVFAFARVAFGNISVLNARSGSMSEISLRASYPDRRAMAQTQ